MARRKPPTVWTFSLFILISNIQRQYLKDANTVIATELKTYIDDYRCECFAKIRNTSSVTSLVSKAPRLPSIFIGPSTSRRTGGHKDICFTSTRQCNWFEVISVPVSACCQNMDLSFLERKKKKNKPLKPACQQLEEVLWEGEEEGLEGGGRKRMGWGCRKWQCVCSDKPVARPSHPGGGLGATRHQPQCSVGILSPMTLPRQLAAICVVDKYMQFANFPHTCTVYMYIHLKKENVEKEHKMKFKCKIHQNSQDMHLNQSVIGLHRHTTGPVIHFYDLYSVFFN